jgi:hypothetical protein
MIAVNNDFEEYHLLEYNPEDGGDMFLRNVG